MKRRGRGIGVVVVVGCAALSSLGCGSSAGPRLDARDGADSVADAPPAGDGVSERAGDVADAAGEAGALACGSETCGDGQICVQEFCGGGPVQCSAPEDGGQCPDAWQPRATGCPSTGGPGCFPPPCQSPPPRCADRPAACGSALACSCIPSALCDGISCASASGRMVTCANQ